ncbi:hypothetical protein D3875_01975 [Deinococcus cavernae]|uniref:Uncharacterized protein n=1 Tax=Deinococcus cavernae TaxID=2320857 RepID=A0A418VGT4_9DEIO|nr:hypothetical protein [Deinococcus cavernae]RJF75289.1 hypothetical protein D3875_01975 [Deinococcus cavernae]
MTEYTEPPQVMALSAAAGLTLDRPRAAALLPLVNDLLAGQRRLAALKLGRASPLEPLWPVGRRPT